MRLVSAYDPALGWTQKLLRVLSGLPSTDFWKKILKILTSIFGQKSKISQGYSMAKKIGRNGDGGRRSNFGLKLNVHVQ